MKQAIRKLYDINCKQYCGLGVGLSEKFEKNVKEQQGIKRLKANITSQIFDDPEKQRKFQSITNDVLFTTLNEPSDQEIFRVGLEGMQRNYPDILNGQQKHLFMCPSEFNYDSRIKPFESSVPKFLEDRKVELEANLNRTDQESKDLEDIDDHLTRIKPQISEGEVFSAFERFFYSNRGIFVHSLKLDNHLKTFIDRARNERNNIKDTGFKLTPLEERIAEVLQIPQKELQDVADKVTDTLKETVAIKSGQLVSGYKIHQAIDATLIGDDNKRARSKFKPKTKYTMSQVVRGIRLAKFECRCRFSGENDFFIMLPDRKLIICVEVKRHMNPDNGGARPNIDGNLQCASDQLKKNANYTSLMHGAILSPDWKFAKVAAIAPYVYNREKICPTCNPFVISIDMINQPGGMEKWWRESGLDKIEVLDEKTKKEAYAEFLKFFNRLVNLSAVRVVPDPFHTWDQILGNNPRHMAAGYTSATPPSKPGRLNVDEILNRPHDAYKIISFNKDQENLLSHDIPSAIFLNDFGAGKSLICKEKGLQTAEKEENEESDGIKAKVDPVFFISLVGVNIRGKVEDYEHIFDIYTKAYDFTASEVVVKSAQDLWDFYEAQKKGSDKTEVDIYTLVECFVQNNPNAHYVLDEVPFLVDSNYEYDAESVKRAEHFIGKCRSMLARDSNLFWVAFQSNVLADLNRAKDNFKNAFQQTKEDLSRKGWILPTLDANMRNQVNISNISVGEGSGNHAMQSSINKLPSGSSIVGEVPLLVQIEQSNWGQKKEGLLKKCMERMEQSKAESNNKNVVILLDSPPRDIEKALKNVIKNKTIVRYPSSCGSKKQSIDNVISFSEQNNHILVTESKYFDGCEASNLIFVSWFPDGVRNNVMRAVQNLICIQLLGVMDAEIKGMKKDNTFC